jgi:NtrC-family two-component system sensor histidine kinase KinB
MLGLRQKLSLGYGGLLIVILVIGTQSILNISRLGQSIDVILRENYRSVIACQQMKEALERIDSGLLFKLLGDIDEGEGLVLENTNAFLKALEVEKNTITLPGEGEKAERLGGLFGTYRTLIKDLNDPSAPAADKRRAYFSRLYPLFTKIKTTADDILQMNQRNMSEANDRARRSASAARSRMLILLFAGSVVASAFIMFTGRWILRPIHKLIRSADEIRRGNLDLVVSGGSRDEIGHLSEAFNAMAASLREFRRSDQAKLIRIQRATQQAFDSLPDAIAVIDSEGLIEVATEPAKNIFGLKPGLAVRALPQDWVADLFRRALEDGRSAGLESPGVIQQFVEAEERFFRPQAVPIKDSDRSTTGVVMVLQDVTQLRQQDEIKRGVIRTVSHQLKTPLTSIRMAIHLLLEERVGALTEKQAELLLTAREDSDRLHGILNSLLDLSRMESGKARLDGRAVPAKSIVMEALEPYRRAAQDQGVSLDIDFARGLPEVWVDTNRIGHVFGNLITNALKHTPPGGRITVAVRPEGDLIRFLVSDTGEGIPGAFLSRVFEPFFRVPGRRDDTGAGLGLAIVKEIVEAHGGTVGAESREGEGSVFSFTLRRAEGLFEEEL